jgi:hypothetical protein
MDVQVEQVKRVFRGPQASSGDDTNLALDQGKTGASHQIPCLLRLKLYL